MPVPCLGRAINMKWKSSLPATPHFVIASVCKAAVVQDYLKAKISQLSNDMAKLILLIPMHILIGMHLLFASFPGSAAISSCNRPCKTSNDCHGQLICVRGKCNDNPNVGTQICNGRNPSPNSRISLLGLSSPPVTASTPGILTLNSFERNGSGGGPSECDGQFHSNSKRIVALSTGWFAGGARCGKKISIRASNGRRVTAQVVDECDSRHGCDNDIVDASDAVWRALGLNEDDGRVPITWSMA